VLEPLRQAAPMRVLIVEDEPVIGMDLEDSVAASGHEVIGWATGHATAMALAEARSPDLAFIDLTLRDGATGFLISKQLAERGVTVVLTTAQADQLSEVEHLLGVMPKPYLPETVEEVLNYAAQKQQSTAFEPVRPAGLRRLKVAGE
jgi:DNA-binding response OmpR family regulator